MTGTSGFLSKHLFEYCEENSYEMLSSTTRYCNQSFEIKL